MLPGPGLSTRSTRSTWFDSFASFDVFDVFDVFDSLDPHRGNATPASASHSSALNGMALGHARPPTTRRSTLTSSKQFAPRADHVPRAARPAPSSRRPVNRCSVKSAAAASHCHSATLPLCHYHHRPRLAGRDKDATAPPWPQPKPKPKQNQTQTQTQNQTSAAIAGAASTPVTPLGERGRDSSSASLPRPTALHARCHTR